MEVKAASMPNVYHRFMIINKKTGEVLDDAQGYGYKTAQKAHAAWSYKHRTPKQAKNHKNNVKINKAFLKKHKHFEDDWAEMCLECYKNGKEPKYTDFKALLNEFDDFNGNAYSLYCYVMNH